MKTSRVILCADDYAISEGVSRGILELAESGRISATSAMVNLPRWTSGDARPLRGVRHRIAIGLHLNLTVGAPLGPMANLAPSGRFPEIGSLTKAALLRRLDPGEIANEIIRQLEAFESALGFPPDHIDGHQHVHALPIIRSSLLTALAHCGRDIKPLVRDPADRWSTIVARKQAAIKATAVAVLTAGFGAMVRRQGYPTNRGFSGFSAFDTGRSYADEITAALRFPGRFPIVMCHPGYPDAELAALDPITVRRRQELDALRAMPNLSEMIWHAQRPAEGPTIDWRADQEKN